VKEREREGRERNGGGRMRKRRDRKGRGRKEKKRERRGGGLTPTTLIHGCAPVANSSRFRPASLINY